MEPKSSKALYLLFAEGCCFLLISVAVIACGFALNHHDNFDYDQVNAEHDYTQYWVGFVVSQVSACFKYGTIQVVTANFR